MDDIEITMQVGELELRKTDSGWQYAPEGATAEADLRDASDILGPFSGDGINLLLDELLAAKESAERSADPAVAAIQYALKDEDGMQFLALWNEGEFDVIRQEWSDVPDEVFIGADPLFIPK